MKFILIITFYLVIFNITMAETKPQWIDIDWDSVASAKGYDIELSEIIDQKSYPRGIFHTDVNHWSKEERSGKYTVRIRAIDNRKVPGSWSDLIPLTVKLPPVQLLKPMQEEVFGSNETDDLFIHFQWNSIDGAKFYQLILLNDKNSILLNKQVTISEYKLKLTKIGTYKWLVAPLLSLEEKLDSNEILNNKNLIFKTFTIKGDALKSPVLDVEIIKNKGFIFKWPEVFRAQNYQFEVFQESTTTGLVSLFKGTTNGQRQLPVGKNKLPNGKYVIAIKATAKDYRDSENARVIVTNEKNNLEILSNESLNRGFIKRPTEASSLEVQFGYPSFKYTNKHFETDTLNEETLRGIRLQAKWRRNFSDNHYQNLFKFDLSQIADSNVNLKSYALSENIGKVYLFNSSRLYLAGGIHFTNIPQVYAARFYTQTFSENFKVLGPTINIQYNYHLNPLWSVEIKSSLSLALLSLSSPEGVKINPSVSSDVELKILYTMNEQFDFYGGINSTSYNLTTKAQTGDNSLALPGDLNRISLSSTYLVFGAEFSY